MVISTCFIFFQSLGLLYVVKLDKHFDNTAEPTYPPGTRGFIETWTTPEIAQGKPLIACVASVSVGFGSKERLRNAIFGILPAWKMGRDIYHPAIFFAPKQHRKACYAGRCKTFICDSSLSTIHVIFPERHREKERHYTVTNKSFKKKKPNWSFVYANSTLMMITIICLFVSFTSLALLKTSTFA